MEWIKCSEKMPLEVSSFHCFRTKTVVVSDGFDVGICDCQAGNMPNAWVDWSIHGDIDADKITHWMPLPEPPSE